MSSPLFPLLAYSKLRPMKQVQAISHLVARTQCLVHLNLWGCKLGDEGTSAVAAALATMPPTSDAHGDDDHSSSSSEPNSRGAPQGVSLSWRGSSLESLDLGFNDVTDAGLRAISKALKANKKLKHLDFRKNQITTEGVEHLCEVRLHFSKARVHVLVESLSLCCCVTTSFSMCTLHELFHLVTSLYRRDVPTSFLRCWSIRPLLWTPSTSPM